MIAVVTCSMPQEETNPSAVVCIKLSQTQLAQVKQNAHIHAVMVGEGGGGGGGGH